MSVDPAELLGDVLRTGSPGSVERWASSGAKGVLAMRDFIDGRWSPPESAGVHPRDVLDNAAWAVAVIAESNPNAFLDAFADDRYHESSFVLNGLGRIDDERATARLARAATAGDWTIRMAAAIGLGRRSSPVASRALRRLVADPEFLVRHHAGESLRKVGVAADVPFLDSVAPDVAAAIRERGSAPDPTG